MGKIILCLDFLLPFQNLGPEIRHDEWFQQRILQSMLERSNCRSLEKYIRLVLVFIDRSRTRNEESSLKKLHIL